MREIETERTVTRAEAAAYLRQFADKLAGEGQHVDDRMADDQSSATTATGQSTTGATQQSPGRTTETTRDETTGTTQEGTTGTTREEVTDTTRQSYGKVTFLVGNDSATVNPPEELTLNVEVGEDSSMMSSGAEKVTFSLHWDKDAVPESDELRIE